MKINLTKLSYIFGILSVLPLLLGCILFYYTNNFIHHAVKTKGTIIKLIPSTKFEGKQLYAPIITFRNMKGKIVEKRVPISSTKRKFQIGNTLNIYYDKNYEHRIVIDSFIGKWFGVLVSIILFLFSLGSALFCFFLQKFINMEDLMYFKIFKQRFFLQCLCIIIVLLSTNCISSEVKNKIKRIENLDKKERHKLLKALEWNGKTPKNRVSLGKGKK